MESIHEQIEYGSYCKPHGTPLGTPGGADLMCGLCESGLTEWVDDPYMGLAFTFGGADEWVWNQAARHARTRWHASDNPDEVWARIDKSLDTMRQIAVDARAKGINEADIKDFYSNHEWRAIEISAGYWTEPTN